MKTTNAKSKTNAKTNTQAKTKMKTSAPNPPTPIRLQPGSRKLRVQPALAHLSDDDRDQISYWLLDSKQTYQDIRLRIAKPRSEGGFDTVVSPGVLQRLRDRTVVLHQINSLLDDKQNLTELLAVHDGREVPWSKGTQQLVQRAAFKIAALPDQSTRQLTALLRIADHPRRVAIDEHKMKILRLRENTHSRLAAVAEKRQRLAEKKYLNPKPKKRSLNDQERLVRHHFGSLPPVTVYGDNSNNSKSGGTRSPSPTSTSRDAANEARTAPADQQLFPVARASSPAGYGTVPVPVERDQTTAKAHANPPFNHSKLETGNSKPSAPSPNSALIPPTSPTAPTAHADLAKRVDRYTTARMREYLAHDQQFTPWPYKHSPPAYSTELRHCPCGHKCPCPTHESSEFGPFPDCFWKLVPTHSDYAAILQAHNLPFRFPSEFIA